MQKAEIQKYATLRNLLTSTMQGTVEILDLYHFWQSNSCTALTIPEGKETEVYTSSAALWSVQGDSAQQKTQWAFLRGCEGSTYLCLQSDPTHQQMCRWMCWFRFPGALVPYTVFHLPVLPLHPLHTGDSQHSLAFSTLKRWTLFPSCKTGSSRPLQVFSIESYSQNLHVTWDSSLWNKYLITEKWLHSVCAAQRSYCTLPINSSL